MGWKLVAEVFSFLEWILTEHKETKIAENQCYKSTLYVLLEIVLDFELTAAANS